MLLKWSVRPPVRAFKFHQILKVWVCAIYFPNLRSHPIWKHQPGRPVTTTSTSTTSVDKLSAEITRRRWYGPSWLRVNDDDDQYQQVCEAQGLWTARYYWKMSYLSVASLSITTHFYFLHLQLQHQHTSVLCSGRLCHCPYIRKDRRS